MTRDDIQILRKLIAQETRFLRHYWGNVLDNADPLNKGRLLVEIPGLGWNGQDRATWCQPRHIAGMYVPPVGSRVEMYFMEGNRSKPVWIGVAHEFAGETPETYEGGGDATLFEDSELTIHKTVDGELEVAAEKLLIDVAEMVIGEGGEPFVLGEVLNQYLTDLKMWLDAITLPVSGSTAGPPAAPSPIIPEVRSEKISGE